MPRRFLTALSAVFFLASGCASVADDQPQNGPASAVTAFVRAMADADTDALAAIFDDDASVFMPFDSVPQRLNGKEEIRTTFGKFFDQVRKSGSPPYMSLEPVDVQTQLLGRDAAIITFHLGKLPAADAASVSVFSRRTFVVQRKGDRWLVEHLHASNMRLQPPKKE